MYESLAEEGKPNDYNIFRFMVAEEYQQKGIGSRAMALVLEEIRAQENAQRVHICYADENQTARAFTPVSALLSKGRIRRMKMKSSLPLNSKSGLEFHHH
ncbi:GNAT family N-acetyltransferase [Shewanella algae]|nr:GNAT family N-acetyltransferase [Shewanella algae]